jgi:hypothetical protein
MSHFTHTKTSFQNLYYLKKALNKLNIVNQTQEINLDQLEFNSKNINLIIPQSNGYDIVFVWNGEEYELVADMSFWEQSYPLESFIEKLTQQYAIKLIIGESQKAGFQLIKSESNADGSNTLVLDRWNN